MTGNTVLPLQRIYPLVILTAAVFCWANTVRGQGPDVGFDPPDPNENGQSLTLTQNSCADNHLNPWRLDQNRCTQGNRKEE